jgi:membrane protein
MKLKSLIFLVKKTAQHWNNDNAARLAAALSYYTIFSIAPILIIAIAVAGFILGRQTVQTQLLAQIQSYVGKSAADLVRSMIQESNNLGASILATGLGTITLLLGASGLFGQLREALNAIWQVEPRPDGGLISTLSQRLLTFFMVLGVGLLLLVSLLLDTGISAVNHFSSGFLPGISLFWQIANQVVSFAIFVLMFALIYKILPDAEIAWNDVWLGAFVTSLLFSIGKYLIGFYLGREGTTSAYGAAGSLVLLLLWVYYSAQIFFFGAEFTQVYARCYGVRIQLKGEKDTNSRREAAFKQVHAQMEERSRKQISPMEEKAEHLLEETPALDSEGPSLLVLSTLIAALAGFLGVFPPRMALFFLEETASPWLELELRPGSQDRRTTGVYGPV